MLSEASLVLECASTLGGRREGVSGAKVGGS
jgi:hypothetical protein